MKIAIVHSFYDESNPSGENSTVVDQAELLGKSHDVTLIGRRTSDLQRGRAINFYVRSASYVSGLSTQRSVLDRINEIGPDLVHVHNTFPNIGNKWLKQLRYPFVATMHNYRTMCSNGLLWRDGNDCFECLERGSHRALVNACYRSSTLATLPLAVSTHRPLSNPILRDARKIVCLNDSARQRFEAIVGVGKVTVIPNFAGGTRNRDRVVNAPPSERSGFVFAGRLAAEKGVSWLYDSWPATSEQLTIAGSGELEEYVSSGVNPRVDYAGRLEKGALLDLLAESKALVLPSLWGEGIPTVALEALSVGTPVIVSAACLSAGLITGSDTNLIFNVSAGFADLEKSINYVNNNAAMLIERSLEIFEGKFSPSVWLSAAERLYGEVLTSAGRPRIS